MKRLSPGTLRFATPALFVCVCLGALKSEPSAVADGLTTIVQTPATAVGPERTRSPATRQDRAERQERQTRRPQRVLTRETDLVYASRFSPDARTLAIARGSLDAGRVELWDVETGTLRHTIGGFDGQVWSVSFAPDGKTLVTGSVEFHAGGLREKVARMEGKRTAELKWWDPQTGELKQQVTLAGAAQTSLMALHSPDGKLLVTVECHYALGSYNADVKLLDARTGEVRFKLKQDLTAVAMPSFQYWSGRSQRFDPLFLLTNLRRQRVAFSPNGELLAFWNSKEVRLWNSTTGAEVLKLKDFHHGLGGVAFPPVGKTLAVATTASSDHKNEPRFTSEIRLYDPDNGTLTQTIPARTQVISCLVFGPTGQQIIIGGWRDERARPLATLELLDLQAGSRGGVTTGESGSVNAIALSSTGNHLIFQTDVTSVNLLDTRTWTITYTFDETSDSAANPKSFGRFLLSVKRVLTVAFSDNGKTLTGQIEQGGIKQWNPITGELKKQLGEADDAGEAVDISRNGAIAADVADDQSVRLWDLNSKEPKVIPASGGPIAAVSLSPDGQMLAIARGERVQLINAATREQLQMLEGSREKVKLLTFSTDGRTLATAGENGTIQIWDLGNGQVTKTMSTGSKVTALRFAPLSRVLASATEDGAVNLWDLQTGTLSQQLKKHSKTVNAIAFSPDGTLIATGGDDRSVILWEVATGKARRTLKGQDLTVSSLAFSPDGTLLASGGGNASVVLWDVRTGGLSRVLK